METIGIYLGNIRKGDQTIQLAGYHGPSVAIEYQNQVFLSGRDCQVLGRSMNAVCLSADCGCGPNGIQLSPELTGAAPERVEWNGQSLSLTPYQGAILVFYLGETTPPIESLESDRVLVGGQDCKILGTITR
ncbi:MAG: hypothetical protein GC154_13365 [bacterium]|nr:hypothetical protein [bacterium]